MKTRNCCSPDRVRAPQGQLINSPSGRIVVCAPVLAAEALALLILSGCSTQQSSGVSSGSVSPFAEEVRFPLGTVALAPDAKPAKFSFDQADGRIGYAADAAGEAAGAILAMHTSEPLLDLAVGVGTLAEAPVVAVEAAIGARKHLPPEKLADCENNLLKAMSEMAVQPRFHDHLLKAAEEQCPGRLIPLGQLQGTHPAPDLVMEARVEELRLERTGASDASYRLRLRTRTRLLRAADRAVLCDRSAEYRSGTCLFRDWTLRDALQSVADTGYRQLADQYVGRLLATTDRPVLAGAGCRRAPALNRHADITLAACQAAPDHRPLQCLINTMANPGALEVYSTRTTTPLMIQRPPTRDEAAAEARSDADVMFDGLTQHPNLLVALPACLVATPISLWKQGATVVRGLSPGTVEKAGARLSKAASETKPHDELALQVAQQLAPLTCQPVVLVQQRSPPGAEGDGALIPCVARGLLASLAESQTANASRLSQGTDTALEIQVQSAALAGDRAVNPKLALCVEARVTLLRCCDGRQLYSCPVQYRSQGRRFTQWAAHDARLFREELQKCYHDLGATVVDQMVGHGPLPAWQPTFVQATAPRVGCSLLTPIQNPASKEACGANGAVSIGSACQ